MKDTQNAIAAVIKGLLAHGMAERSAAYEAICNAQIIRDAVSAVHSGDVDTFKYRFQWPIEEVIRAVTEAATNNCDAQFLFCHSEFIEAHFENLIIKFEGTGCCADKSKTIMAALANHFVTGKEIKFNYEAEYTYHLPKKIFKTHTQICAFFYGLKNLYYGNPELYLTALHQVTEQCTNKG